MTLNSSVYTKIRYRYKTSDTNIKAKIVLEFSNWADGDSEAVNLAAGKGQLILDNTSSITLTVGTATITAAKIVANVRLYANSAAGQVYYDFVEIYEGDYILPNCTKLTPPNILRDATLKPFGMLGAHTQAGGSELKTVSMSCDLDAEGAVVTWKRPQTGSPTDKTKTEVFELIAYEEAKSVPWHWLNWGSGAMKVRLTQFTPNYFGDNTLDLEWTEYRLSSAGVAHESYRTRTSMDQVT
jgi:hypothetical protein